MAYNEKKRISNLRWNIKNPDKMKVYHKKAAKKQYEKNKIKIIRVANKYNKERDSGLFIKYMSMKIRCTYPSQYAYKYYGGKGIKVLWSSYNEFKKDMFESYILHVEEFGRRQTSLERKDNNKHYCKENCCWIKLSEQTKNRTFKRTRDKIEINT